MRAILLALLLAPTAGAAWHRVATPNFEILAESSGKRGRELILQLEQLRQVFGQSGGAPGTPLPLRVFLFRSERDFAHIRPTPYTKGFFQAGPERDLIAVLDTGEEARRALNHEYIHLVLSHSTAALPLWLEEGTAEFYSTLHVEDDRVTLGTPIPEHPRTLAAAGWLDADAFFLSDRESRIHNESRRIGAFYAQSWAMVHMLNMAPGFRQRMPRYAELLDQALDPNEAFRQAFSLSPAEALARLRAYVSHGSYPVARVQAGPSESVSIESSELSPAEAALAQVELLLLRDQPGEAARLLKKLPEDNPETQTTLGLIALAGKKDQEAAGHFRRSIEMGATAATPYFELAMLLRDSKAPAAEVRRYLAEAAGRNPKHAEAHFLLGLDAQQQGRHRDALDAFNAALAVLPRQSYFWHAFAVSLKALDRVPEAARAARKAVDTARTTHEFEMAGALRRSLAQSVPAPPPSPPVTKPAVTIPDSWSMPKGDARVEGTLEHIDCLGASARFHVRGREGVRRLWVDNPGEVLLRTESALTFTFACGAQQPRKVTIEYKSDPDSRRRIDGVVTAIAFE